MAGLRVIAAASIDVSRGAMGNPTGASTYSKLSGQGGNKVNNSTQEQTTSARELQPPGRVPQMSVILATDSYETIRAVIERLRRQTLRQDIELVLVAPSTAAVDEALAYREDFAAMKVVEANFSDISTARAVGIRCATAPLIYVAETHSYARPNLAEVLIPALTDSWAAVTPAIGNANPKSALSWAAFLSDYGQWAEGLPAGEIPAPPPHNAVFRRDVLLELGDRLEPALGLSDELPRWMHAHGHRTYFEPAAQIDHINVTRPWDWACERFVSGWVVASHRVQNWSLGAACSTWADRFSFRLYCCGASCQEYGKICGAGIYRSQPFPR